MMLFKETGNIFREQDELFTEAAWQQVMIGQGIEPKSYHTLADSLSDEQASELLQNLSAIMQGTAAKLPSHNDFLSAFKP
jgi:tryptophan halogenase